MLESNAKTARRGHAMLSRMRRSARFCSLFLALALTSVFLEARVVRVDVSSRSDVLQGQKFGDAGSYERIVGRVYFSVEVSNPHNRRIVDLSNAVNLRSGEVDFSADFIAFRPKHSEPRHPDPCGKPRHRGQYTGASR